MTPIDGSRFLDWPAPARALVERSAARHGGWERWEALDTVSFRMTALSGLVPALKGLGRSFARPSTIVVTPHAFLAVFADYPAPGARIEFERGTVRRFDASGALVGAEDPRRRFAGFEKWRPWTPADAAYFFGYALSYYQSAPFLLARTAFVRAAAPYNGASGVTVDVPGDVVTHCRRQTFFFADDGRIVRHDYVAEIVGAWARGSHFWSNYDESSALLVARTRHVTPRLFNRPLLGGVALHGELDDVRVRFRGDAAE